MKFFDIVTLNICCQSFPFFIFLRRFHFYFHSSLILLFFFNPMFLLFLLHFVLLLFSFFPFFAIVFNFQNIFYFFILQLCLPTIFLSINFILFFKVVKSKEILVFFFLPFYHFHLFFSSLFLFLSYFFSYFSFFLLIGVFFLFYSLPSFHSYSVSFFPVTSLLSRLFSHYPESFHIFCLLFPSLFLFSVMQFAPAEFIIGEIK